MSVIEDFKKFALKGNVVDLAVGVIMGAAFGKVVSSLVDQFMTPPLGLLIGGVDFSHLKLVLQKAHEGHEEVAIGFGIFLQEVINLMIVAGALFVVIKIMSKLHLENQAATPPAAPPEDVVLLREIRDQLKSQQKS